MALKVGVIGVGYLGRHHARILSGLQGVELAAVVDQDEAAARAVADEYKAPFFSDYRQALAGLDAVCVVTPTTTHFDVAMDCLGAGLDVLLEKPMTVTPEEADRLIDEAGKRGRVLQVGHLERYNPAVEALGPLVDKPWFFEAERVSPFLGRATDVDVTLDLMIHDIDVIMSLTGGAAITGMKVAGASVITDRIDVAKAWLQFDNGCSALITASRISQDTVRTLRVYQSDLMLLVDYKDRRITRYRMSAEGTTQEPIPVQEDCEPLREELADFAACVGGSRKPRVTGAEGRRALEVAMRISDLIRGIDNR